MSQKVYKLPKAIMQANFALKSGNPRTVSGVAQFGEPIALPRVGKVMEENVSSAFWKSNRNLHDPLRSQQSYADVPAKASKRLSAPRRLS